jgi:hypothetical protein
MRLLRLPVDALLAAAGVVYLGPLNAVQRARLCSAWQQDEELKSLFVRSPPTFDVESGVTATSVLSLIMRDPMEVSGQRREGEGGGVGDDKHPRPLPRSVLRSFCGSRSRASLPPTSTVPRAPPSRCTRSRGFLRSTPMASRRCGCGRVTLTRAPPREKRRARGSRAFRRERRLRRRHLRPPL